MLILVGVTISFVQNGGLLTRAKQASKQYQIEADREALLIDVVAALDVNGNVDLGILKTLATADGFSISENEFPVTATSKAGNQFTVTEDGVITFAGNNGNPGGNGSSSGSSSYSGSESTEDDLELLRRYFVGKRFDDLILSGNVYSSSGSYSDSYSYSDSDSDSSSDSYIDSDSDSDSGSYIDSDSDSDSYIDSDSDSDSYSYSSSDSGSDGLKFIDGNVEDGTQDVHGEDIEFIAYIGNNIYISYKGQNYVLEETTNSNSDIGTIITSVERYTGSLNFSSSESESYSDSESGSYSSSESTTRHSVYIMLSTAQSILASTVEDGATYSCTLVPINGYQLPSSIRVQMSGTDLNTNQYMWNSTTGELTIPNVSGNIIVTPIQYNISFNGTNITKNGANTVNYGETYSCTLTADEHYSLPSTITVTMGGTTLSANNNEYTWNNETGALTIPNVTGNIVITAVGEPIIRNVTFNITNATTNGELTINDGDTYTCTFTPSAHYSLPNNITVTMGGKELKNKDDYSWNVYNNQTGGLSIPNVTGDIVVTVNAEPIIHNVSIARTGVTINETNTVNDGATYSCTVTPNTNYRLPSSITVTMGGVTLDAGLNQYSWNSTTGYLSIPNVTGNLQITITGEYLIYNVTNNLSNVSTNGTSTARDGNTYSCTITPSSAYYRLPENITVTMGGVTLDEGLNQYTWNYETGALSIPNVTGQLVITIVGEDSLAGQYVQYEGILWRILYNDRTNGLQLVSANALQVNNSDVSLGYNDPGAILAVPAVDENNPTNAEKAERARWSYNNAIETIVTACKDATGLTIDGTDVISIRSVGNTDVKYTSTGLIGTDNPGIYTYDWETLGAESDWYTANGYNSYNMKTEDNNYQADYNRMNTLRIKQADNGTIYLLASRNIDAYDSCVVFPVYNVSETGGLSGGYRLCDVVSNGQWNGYDRSYAVRPVVSLNSTLLEGATGSGTSADPFVIQ